MEDNGKHIYNILTLDNKEEYIFDLEDDLEYIQSGAKTRRFGINTNQEKPPIVSEKELRQIDQEKAEYIPEGYYLEDIIWMLKLAISPQNLKLDEKLEFILKNLNVYKDNTKVKYREMVRYHDRVLCEMFCPKELRKIHQIDCCKKIENEKIYQSCIMVELSNNKKKVYLFSPEKYEYEEISMQGLAQKVAEGLQPLEGVPGLRGYLNKIKQGMEH